MGSNGVFSYQLNDTTIEAVSVTATSVSGNTSEFSSLELITDVENQDETIPTEFSLKQNFPNPFNPATKINFSIPKSGNVSLKIYDLLGREVAELINTEMQPGNYSYDFNAGQLSSGMYFSKIEAGQFSQMRKMMLLK